MQLKRLSARALAALGLVLAATLASAQTYDANGNLLTLSSQGTAAAITGRWPVYHTDGTFTMPTGDAPARRIYFQLTDGTNSIGVTASNELKTTSVQSGNWTSRIVGNAGATLDSTVGAAAAPANQVVTGLVYNSTAPAPTTGQAMAVQADQAGNERVTPGIATAALSAWNSGTGLNATQTIFSNSGVGEVLVHLVQTTTLTAGAITFEVSYDNTNWVTIPADAVLDPSSTSYAQIALPYTVQASTNKPFLLVGKGWQGLRIKLSTQITGSGTVTPNYALIAYETAGTMIALSPTAANFNVTTTPPANASTNLAQVAGNTTLTNEGDVGAGSLRTVESGYPTITAGQVSVTTSATSIVSARAGRKAVVITNASAVDIYLGPSGVATTTGTLLLGTKGTSISFPSSAAIFGISSSGTNTVTYAEIY